MKTMKSLKQQMTTAVSLTLVALAIAACAPEQALAKGKGRAGVSANFSNRRGGSGDNYTGAAANARQRNNAQRLLGRGDGSFQQRNNAPQQDVRPKAAIRVDTSNMRDLNNAVRRGVTNMESFGWGEIRGAKRNQLRGEEWRDWGVKRNSAKPNYLSGDVIVGGSGNDNVRRQSRAGQPNRLSDFGPTGSISVGGSRNESVGGITNARRNPAGSSEPTNSSYLSYELKNVLVSGYSKPKSNLTANNTYAGATAKSRDNRGH